VCARVEEVGVLGIGSGRQLESAVAGARGGHPGASRLRRAIRMAIDRTGHPGEGQPHIGDNRENRWANDIDGSASQRKRASRRGGYRKARAQLAHRAKRPTQPAFSQKAPRPSRPNLDPRPDTTAPSREQFHAPRRGVIRVRSRGRAGDRRERLLRANSPGGLSSRGSPDGDAGCRSVPMRR
jgi:hypothetical protein